MKEERYRDKDEIAKLIELLNEKAEQIKSNEELVKTNQKLSNHMQKFKSDHDF